MTKKIIFNSMKIEDAIEKKELLKIIENIFDYDQIINAPEVDKFEKEISLYCNKKFAVSVGCGSDALLLALKALKIGPNDEVITTSLSWIATANAIARAGAKPVFADINDDLNIDPESVRKLITKKTKAIMPVHFGGKICQMDALIKIAKEHNLFLIEDAAQAFGAKYKNQISGSLGDIACFSMNPMKILRAHGEAGCVLTNDSDIENRLKILRYNGTINKEICVEISSNHRIDTIQAAILLYRLKKVDDLIKKRRQVASWYNERLKNIVKVPTESHDDYSVYYVYAILTDKRDELKEFLASKNIETRTYYAKLMPHQPVFVKDHKSKIPKAEEISKKLLCLPIDEKMTLDDVDYVTHEITSFYEKNNKKLIQN